ncbi:MAG: UvrD-helicase domain-containing protein, partial [Cyclobacteriaceae bacterium]
HTLDEEYQKVLLVGDIKQSIYRWRGGDKNLLLHKVQDDLSLYKAKWKEEGLNDNWRSLKNVVGFNNMFFQAAIKVLQLTKELPPGQPTLEQVYREVVQNAKGGEGGFVEVQFFEGGEAEETYWEAQALERTRSIIHNSLENGAKYQDILILVEKNEHANQISSQLTTLNIPVISDQALKLSQHPVVRFLISLLYTIQDPADDLAKAETFYLYKIIKEQPVDDYHQLFYRPWLSNQGWENKLQSAKGLSSLIGKPLYELVEEIVILFNLPGSSFLQRFQDLCLDQATKGVYQVGTFLEWYELKKETLTLISPSNHDAVTVMTVHKAKGLEAPIVIVPFAAFAFRPKGIFWTNKLEGSSYSQFKLLPLQFNSNLLQSHFKNSYQQELLEELVERLNVAYVAFTRAKEQLYILAPRSKKTVPENDIKDLGQLLWIVLDQNNQGHAELRQIEQGIYRWGNLQPLKAREKADKQNAKSYVPRGSNAYQSNISIRSEAGRFFLLFDNEKAAKIKDGIKLHAVLERLGNLNQLQLVLTDLVNQGIIQPFETELLGQAIEGLFEDPLFASWFKSDWETYTEREILSEGSVYKPDRVIVKGTEAVVIDYKREQHQIKYEQQVTNYARVLNEIGYSTVKKYLVYVQDFSIVEVS